MDLAAFWTVPDHPPKQSDCFVVLSYAIEDRHHPTKPTKAALDLAYSWWKKFPKSSIIVSTGDNQGVGVPNSTVMKEYLENIGVPEKYILEEGKSLDTVQNLKYCRDIIGKKKLRQITFVMYDLHVRRMLGIAQKQGWKDFCWVSQGSQGSPAHGLKAFQTYSRYTILVYELLATVYNRFMGQL